MSSKVAFSKPSFFTLSCNGHRRHGTRHFPCRIKMQSKTTPETVEEEEGGGSIRFQQVPPIPYHVETSRRSSDLQFNKLQQLDIEMNHESRVFGDFVAREAVLDEEYWTAAWLRAETHWEDRPNERYADSYKRKFAEQEFNALQRRCKGYHGQTCTCIVTVKEDENVKRTVIKSVVGTLDLSIRNLLQGETFPGERVKAPLFCSIDKKKASRYGYVGNLCVAKSARRKGIAINMMKFAIESAKLKEYMVGAERVYVNVRRENTAARQLYQKLGFEMVDIASPQPVEDQMYLLSLKIDDMIH